jgi:hypothetical protein
LAKFKKIAINLKWIAVETRGGVDWTERDYGLEEKQEDLNKVITQVEKYFTDSYDCKRIEITFQTITY